MFETLESRVLLEGQELGTAVLEAGVLSIWGTGDNDVIRVSQYDNRTIIVQQRQAGQPAVVTTFNFAEVQSISIVAYAGDDVISLDNVLLPGNPASGEYPVIIDAGLGNDTVHGSIGPDLIHGSGGNDLIYGMHGDDELYGDAGNDTLDGGPGNDTIDGGAGTDYMFGKAGHDSFLAYDNEPDVLIGGSGKDFAFTSDFYFDVYINIRSVSNSDVMSVDTQNGNILRIYGSARGDNIRIRERNGLIYVYRSAFDPYRGRNRVTAIYDKSELSGGIYVDTGLGNDRISNNSDIPMTAIGGLGNDTILGGLGNDVLVGDTGGDVVPDALDNDYINGLGGDDVIIDQQGRNRLFGGLGDDEFHSQNGETDFIDGGAGTNYGETDTGGVEDILRSIAGPIPVPPPEPGTEPVPNL